MVTTGLHKRVSANYTSLYCINSVFCYDFSPAFHSSGTQNVPRVSHNSSRQSCGEISIEKSRKTLLLCQALVFLTASLFKLCTSSAAPARSDCNIDRSSGAADDFINSCLNPQLILISLCTSPETRCHCLNLVQGTEKNSVPVILALTLWKRWIVAHNVLSFARLKAKKNELVFFFRTPMHLQNFLLILNLSPKVFFNSGACSI